LAPGGTEHDIELVFWDVAARKERLSVRHLGVIDAPQFTPDGAVLLASADPNPSDVVRRYKTKYWDVATGREVPALPGLDSDLDLLFSSATFSPNGGMFSHLVPQPVSQGVTSPARELLVYRYTTDPLVRVTLGKPLPEPPAPTEATLALQTVRKEIDDTMLSIFRRQREAKTSEQQQAIQRDTQLSMEGILPRMLDLLRKHPKDPAALDPLSYALENTRTDMASPRLAELGQEALALIRQHYLTDAEVGRFLRSLGGHRSSASEELLRDILEKHPDRTIQGRAGLTLASAWAERALRARLVQQTPDMATMMERHGHKVVIESLRATDPAALERQVEQLYERLLRDYADVRLDPLRPQQSTVGEAVERALPALRGLVVGKPALDIEGPDLDGKRFKLNDYRGKVVVLVFGGHWCPGCRELDVHLRAMVKRLADQPFAVLEVNSDEGDIKERKQAAGDTWRCWPDGRDGPIHRRWNINRAPAIFVLDAQGVIRQKDLGDEKELDKAVDALLKQQERK
jgi:thiol-disulfide isomerase/thioredoxin